MGTRFRFLPGLLVPVFLLGLNACKTSSSTTSSGTGALFVSTQGDSLVSAYTINLATGVLTANGAGVATGTIPSAMLLAPSGSALFIVNSNPAITPTVPPTPCTLPDNPGSISAYTVKSDGTLSPASGSAPAGLIPLAMAIDSGGHFLFVANQGLQCKPDSGTISVFSIQDTTLTKVGSDVPVADPSAPSNPGPAGIAVTPDGGFLYIANSGSSNVSAFAVCNQVVTSCSNPTSPDGTLTPLSGSPFSAGLGPTSIVAAPSGKFLFVVDRQSNQISEYKLATGTGVLTANTQASISTGGTPAGVTLRTGTTIVSTTQGTTDYLYVANLGASTMTVFSFDSTVGVLGLVGSPVTTGGQPSAVATK